MLHNPFCSLIETSKHFVSETFLSSFLQAGLFSQKSEIM